MTLLLYGALMGLLMGIPIGIVVHREGCLWARQVALKDEKKRMHVERLQKRQERQERGQVDAWVR